MFDQKGFYMNAKQRFMTTIRGFTILELMIVLVISAIGVALAVPTYQGVMQRRETTAQAEGLAAFVAFAQGEAIKNNRLISVHLTYTDEKNWCFGAIEGNAPCDCEETTTTEADYCSLNGVEKIFRSPENTRSRMTIPSADRTLVFDPVRGTMTAAGLDTDHNVRLVSDDDKWFLRVDVEVTGRITVCSPVAAKAVPGFKPCI